ncbi:MAG TPA: dynein gamma chain protein [Coriobacteriia bacterium]|nr:dynein gamma chain protein [Coriobacteriia bacterium]
MCTNGVNTGQFKSNIEQIDEAVALTRRWVHRAYHTADDAGQAKTAALLQNSQRLLDEVRALLSEATDTVEKEAEAGSGVSVNLV